MVENVPGQPRKPPENMDGTFEIEESMFQQKDQTVLNLSDAVFSESDSSKSETINSFLKLAADSVPDTVSESNQVKDRSVSPDDISRKQGLLVEIEMRATQKSN